jgi:hypothetical protein
MDFPFGKMNQRKSTDSNQYKIWNIKPFVPCECNPHYSRFFDWLKIKKNLYLTFQVLIILILLSPLKQKLKLLKQWKLKH